MKFFLAICVSLSLVACSKKATTPPSTTDNVTAAATAGVSCDKEIARECGEGFVDGCSKSLTKVHACVAADAAAGADCAQEIAMQCGDGQVDGCMIGASASHVCVQK